MRNTKFGIITPLSLHADAASDLRGLMVGDPDAAGKILAFLEQAKRDPKIIASLLDHDFGDTRREPYHVLAIVHRDFNYDPSHAVTQRILVAYHSIGITTRH